jgi:hypothetical protein
MLPTLLTVRETAAAMKLSESAVRSLCDKQLLKVTRVGAGRGRGTLRIFEASILEYLEQQTRTPISLPARQRPSMGTGFAALERLGYRWPGAPQSSGGRSSGRGARSV